MSRANNKVKTDTISSVRKELQNIGDSAATVFNTTTDLKSAELAMKAYNGAVNAAKTQLMYKKMTGLPGSIGFFEED